LLIQLLKSSFTGGRPLELLVLPKQLGHRLGYIRDSFDELKMISYRSKETENIGNTRGAFLFNTSQIMLESMVIPYSEMT
jgi:hypothetical protein